MTMPRYPWGKQCLQVFGQGELVVGRAAWCSNNYFGKLESGGRLEGAQEFAP